MIRKQTVSLYKKWVYNGNEYQTKTIGMKNGKEYLKKKKKINFSHNMKDPITRQTPIQQNQGGNHWRHRQLNYLEFDKYFETR